MAKVEPGAYNILELQVTEYWEQIDDMKLIKLHLY